MTWRLSCRSSDEAGRVVGNVVSTVKDACYTGQKLMIIDYIDENGSLTGNQAIAFDVADAGSEIRSL